MPLDIKDQGARSWWHGAAGLNFGNCRPTRPASAEGEEFGDTSVRRRFGRRREARSDPPDVSKTCSIRGASLAPE
jgi:hypothetical protein